MEMGFAKHRVRLASCLAVVAACSGPDLAAVTITIQIPVNGINGYVAVGDGRQLRRWHIRDGMTIVQASMSHRPVNVRVEGPRNDLIWSSDLLPRHYHMVLLPEEWE